MEGKARRGPVARPALAALAAGILVVLFVAGLTLANSIGASRVADNAASLHWLNGASAASGLTRAALAQEITFVGLEGRGLATSEDAEFASAQVVTAQDRLTALQDSGGAGEVLSRLTAFAEQVAVVRSVLSADGAAAATESMPELEVAYEDLRANIEVEQEAVLAAIDSNTRAAARVDDYLSVLLTLAVPVSGVLVYWAIARRQVREMKDMSRLELEAEKELSRAKDAFISGLSHELRTPLTSVYGFATILSDPESSHETAEVNEMAGEIAREASELARMVDDLIVASRFESTGVAVELGPTPLDSLVENALQPFLQAGCALEWSPSDLVVTTDGSRLRQVLVNLLSNAVRHGGHQAGVSASVHDDRAEIEVWDDGPGLAPEVLDRIDQQRFAHDGETSLITGSVGLGLSVARRLVDRLDGTLTYRRMPGRTSFVLSVPLEEMPVPVEQVTPRLVIRANSG